MISFEEFLQNANPDDVRALAILAGGELIKTQDAVEADTYQAIGVRLKQAGLLSRFRRSLEDIGDSEWHVFDGRVKTAALIYVADAAKFHIEYLRAATPAG